MVFRVQEKLNYNKKAMKQQYLPISVIYENQLVIRIPHARVLQLLARSILLSCLILSFPWIESIVQIAKKNAVFASHNGISTTTTTTTTHTPSVAATPTPMDSSSFPPLFKDLVNEGIFKYGQKALFLTSGDVNDVATQQLLSDNDIDIVSESDQQRLNSIPQDAFDFILSSGFSASEFIDRTLKVGGVVVVQLLTDATKAFKIPSNYKIVYIRRFDANFVAMRKTSPSDKSVNLSPGRRLLGFESEAKKAALDGLEDVVLEPPRASSTEYKKYLRKTKYLPELTGDSLDGYPRRVFIDVALPGKSGNGDSIKWFKSNYPTRNRVFDMYNIEMVADSNVQQVGVSDWLRKNVKQEEYVVMKAEADVVEEMINSRAIGLVDELFFECKHQWQKGKKNKGKRAYWECLSLYGRLRDEGIAVHQWWA